MPVLQEPIDTPTPPSTKPEEHFHKSLPVGNDGLVHTAAWTTFLDTCRDAMATVAKFDLIASGALPGTSGAPTGQSGFAPGIATPPNVAKFVSPLAGWASGDGVGPSPNGMVVGLSGMVTKFRMPKPPSITSMAIAAEMNELYWMAALRDVPFDQLGATAVATGAINDINAGYSAALAEPGENLSAHNDIPHSGKVAVFNATTLFKSGLKGEEFGPFISQFFLQDINYGAQLIKPTQVPYRAGRDYLTDVPSWLLAQNTGYDVFAEPYNHDNDLLHDKLAFVDPLPDGSYPRYYMRTMRDLCRFVNRDALHQAYFNAALLLNNWNVRQTSGNTANTARQSGFATLGGPEILAIVGTVAAYALRTVWHQKWAVWLRLRPEAAGGLATLNALSGQSGHALAGHLAGLKGAQNNHATYGNYLLPIAFSAGSPAHPSYGAGHASVAGACVTLLKAWFDGSVRMADVFAGAASIDPAMQPVLRQPADHPANGSLPVYTGSDALQMTVEGELNKLASNVALGRSMGGVHFRTDNTRSLRLGEAVTTIFLMNWVRTYAEKPIFGFTSFDGNTVTINAAGVTVTAPGAMTGATYASADDVVAAYNSAGHI